jgi:hypothetical protein
MLQAMQFDSGVSALAEWAMENKFPLGICLALLTLGVIVLILGTLGR